MFVREDWTLFRNLGTLSQKAGVPLHKLRRLVVKELVDNALDACGEVEFGKDGLNTYWVQDNGPGIPGDAAAIARLFSVNRPLTSTKVVRLPARGALGNGLRVVVGAALASGGNLAVVTRGREYRLQPLDDGSTRVVFDAHNPGRGTRVAVTLKEGVPEDENDLILGKLAQNFAFAKQYKGKTSAWWYDSDSFHELLQSADDRDVGDLVVQFDGFGISKGEAPSSSVLSGLTFGACNSLTREQSEELLKRMRAARKPVPKTQIGSVGNPGEEPYGREAGTIIVSPGRGSIKAELPFVVEAWASERPSQDDDDILVAYVNGTPVVGETTVRRDKPTKIAVFGCGLKHYVERVSPRKALIKLNITTPYMPITTDGKEPDFARFIKPVEKAISRATRKLRSHIKKRENPHSQTDVILRNIPAAAETASGEGVYRFSLRQLYYAVRPFCLQAGFTELAYGHYCKTITDYESTRGEIPGMYRDPRGTLYHPHTRQSIPIGTLAVESYKRPEWTFNKILYCEKEGFTHLLQSDGWPERHDCALLSSKGFASRAVRDVLDLLGDTQQELLFFCIHDADASGGLIYQALQEATTARAARRVKIINLGLDPWEAVEMELQVEEFRVKGDKKLPVARYVRNHDDPGPPRSSGTYEWSDWLQGRRVELNAMTSPQFIAWLDEKMAPYDTGKVLPPPAVLQQRLEEEARKVIREREANRILAAAGLDDIVESTMESIAAKLKVDPSDRIRDRLEAVPSHQWTEPVSQLARDISKEEKS